MDFILSVIANCWLVSNSAVLHYFVLFLTSLKLLGREWIAGGRWLSGSSEACEEDTAIVQVLLMGPE